jgi:hypothetical protein
VQKVLYVKHKLIGELIIISALFLQKKLKWLGNNTTKIAFKEFIEVVVENSGFLEEVNISEGRSYINSAEK